MANIIQEIPWEQKAIIIKSLQRMLDNVETIEILNTESSDFNYLKYDLKMLKKLMTYKINIELTEKEFSGFSKDNGTAFPEYVITEKPTDEQLKTLNK